MSTQIETDLLPNERSDDLILIGVCNGRDVTRVLIPGQALSALIDGLIQVQHRYISRLRLARGETNE